MSHCVDCYGTSTIAPCATTGCISINYGKCILYSGQDLYCSLGAVGTFTVSGTAVVPGTTTTVVVTPSATSGSGTGATFEVTRTAGSADYTVVVASKGSSYAIGDTITLLGTDLGGTSPTNDITLTVTALAAVISTGSNLDTIIEKFHDALCSGIASSGGIDYSTLTYGCLRQNGALNGIGSVITTEDEFVESVAAALCTINTTLEGYDTGIDMTPIANQANITGLVAAAPYNVNEAVNLVAGDIGLLKTNLDLSSVSVSCPAYTFTTNPGTDVAADYINWLATNMCGMYTDLAADISTSNSTITSITSYISGVSSLPASVDTSSITGGTVGSTLHTAVNTIVTNIATLNTAIASVPTSTYAVTWATCFGGSYPTNSTFKGQTWNYTNTAASIQTQFDRIASVLSQLNTKFDAAYFTVTAGSCGPTISLASGIAFSASSLNTVSINSLQDVNTVSAVDGDFFVYDTGSNEWVPKELVVTVNGSGTGVTKTDTASGVTIDLTVATAATSEIPFVGYSSGDYTVVGSTRFTTGGQPFPYATKVGDIATINGIFQLNVVGSMSWTSLSDKTIATVPATLQPTTAAHFNAVFFVRISGVYSVVHGTVTINGSTVSANLMSPSGSLVMTSGDLIEISIAGCSYAV